MAAASASGSLLSKALTILLPKGKKQPAGGFGLPSEFNPGNTTGFLPLPTYRDHLTDIFTTRSQSDSRALLQTLFLNDPDVSAAVASYLTSANQPLMMHTYGLDNQIDPSGQLLLDNTVALLTQQFDYTQGFIIRPSLQEICENMRYMGLLRGALSNELVFDKNGSPFEIRTVDMLNIFFKEALAGFPKPEQHLFGQIISLDIPTYFISYFHRDPTQVYPTSPFVAAINTIAARQQVVNDLYRIMQITGYPRMDVKVLEDVIVKNAPGDVKQNKDKLKAYLTDRITEVRSMLSGIRPEQAMVHYDSVEFGTLNENMPAMSIDISSVIEVLNSQNQAGLKVMATIIGRGESGVNTASVEARIFSMSADELNVPVANQLSKIFTLALRLQGFQGYVRCWFKPVELRPADELEPMMAVKQQRLLENLSLGTITDDEYHMQMFNRPAPATAPLLSGTGFIEANAAFAKGDPAGEAPSPNGTSLGRALAPDNAKAGRSNTVKPKPKAKISSTPPRKS